MLRTTLVIALSVGSVVPAHATFSIAAVDPATGEVGSAGASCIAGSIILSDVHPGVGVVHTQSFWNPTNQAYARSLMDDGFSPDEIIDLVVMNDAQGDPTIRQYGVVDLVDGGRSAGYTGSNCFDYANHFLGDTYAVAGNIVLHPSVLLNMEAAFLGTVGTLADRLMAALQAANVPMADTRCSTKPAISAFLRVARPTDADNDLTLDLNVNDTSFSQNPIDLLQGLYDDFVGTLSAPTEAIAPRLTLSANPFRGDLHVTFDVVDAGRVRVTAFDVAGRRLGVVLDRHAASGATRATWDQSPAPGVYFVRVETPSWTETQRVVRAR